MSLEKKVLTSILTDFCLTDTASFRRFQHDLIQTNAFQVAWPQVSLPVSLVGRGRTGQEVSGSRSRAEPDTHTLKITEKDAMTSTNT